MPKNLPMIIVAATTLAPGLYAQDLVLDSAQTYTVMGDETYGKLLLNLNSTLIVPEGASITMTEQGARTRNDGGTIILDGGDYTVFHRQDMGLADGATLLANSGTFSVLDWDIHPTDPGAEGMKVPDFTPSGPGSISQLIIGDAEVFVKPYLDLFANRQSLITFTPDGAGFLDLQDINFAGPSDWLAASEAFPGFGLFAPEGETIIIETLANGHTRVTSRRVLAPNNLFTWELLADDSWNNAAGWQENGAPTTNIPVIDLSENLADEVEVISGIVRVDAADQGAWSVDVKSGATAVVAQGRTLRVAEHLTIDSGGEVEARSDGLLSVEQDLNVAVSGTLTIHNGAVSVAQTANVAGTVVFTGTESSPPAAGDFDGNNRVNGLDFMIWQRGGSPSPSSPGNLADWNANFGKSGTPRSTLTLDSGALAAVNVVGTGTIETPLINVGEATVGQLTMGSTSRLVKQGVGVLILDQTQGASSLAAGAQISIAAGSLVAMNDGANHALDQATVQINGGALILTSTQPVAAGHDSPLEVLRNGDIVAAQRGNGAVAGGTVTLGGTHGISVRRDAIAHLTTADGYTVRLAGDVAGTGRIDFGDAAAVLVESQVAPSGVGYRGDLSQVVVAGTVAPTDAYYFNPTSTHRDMTVGFSVAGNVDVFIGDLDGVDGSVGFTGGLNHAGATQLRRGALRLGNGNATPAAGPIEFNAHGLDRAAVIESAEATYLPTIGASAGSVHWTGAGGFSSRQGGAGTTVTINGGAALDWNSDLGGFNNQALQLGSNTADAPIILTNDLNLGNASERVIQVANNPDSPSDVARLTGVIASTGSSTDLLRVNKRSENGFHSGLLELLGNNSFANTLRIDSGTLYAVEGTGLPTQANLQFSGNQTDRATVLATHGTFTRSIGAGAGQVSWAADAPGVDDAQGGGFAARGGPLNVTLAGGTVLWNDPAGLNGQDLHLGSQYADDLVTFNNDLDGQGAFHNIQLFDNPDSSNDGVILNSNIANVDGLAFPGNGRLVFNGNVSGNTGRFAVGSGNAVVIFNGNQTGTSNENVLFEVAGSSMLFLNGTVDVGDDVQFGNNSGGPSLGGTGRINLFGGTDGTFDLEPGAHLRPGADVDAVGTLTVNLLADSNSFSGSFFEAKADSTYHMQFAEEAGVVVHDSVDLISEFGASFISSYLALEKDGDSNWNLDLSALESLDGLISPADEFDLFTLGQFVKLLDFDTQDDTIFTAPIITGSGEVGSATILPSADFDTSAAKIMYDAGSSSGRIYVTGLSYTGTGSSTHAVRAPEPTTALLGLLAFFGVLGGPARHAQRRRP